MLIRPFGGVRNYVVYRFILRLPCLPSAPLDQSKDGHRVRLVEGRVNVVILPFALNMKAGTI